MSPRRTFLVFAAALVLTTPAMAMRVVAISVQVDGKPYLTGQHGDSGGTHPAVAWRYLRDEELSTVQGVTVAPDPDDPLRATLRGDITVSVNYGGRATVKELHLVRRTPTANWMIAPADIESMARDIGLEHIPVVLPDHPTGVQTNPPPPTRTLVWVGVAGFFLLLIAAVVVLILWGRRSPGSPSGGDDPRD